MTLETVIVILGTGAPAGLIVALFGIGGGILHARRREKLFALLAFGILLLLDVGLVTAVRRESATSLEGALRPTGRAIDPPRGGTT